MLIFYRLLFVDEHYDICNCEYFASRIAACRRAAEVAARPRRKRQRWNKVLVSEVRLPADGSATIADVVRCDCSD